MSPRRMAAKMSSEILRSRNCGGAAGTKGASLQVRAIQTVQTPQVAHRQRRLERIDITERHIQVLHQKMHHLVGHRLIHGQAHYRPELALAQPLLDGLQQIRASSSWISISVSRRT